MQQSGSKRVALVTGANKGIGFWIVKKLAQRQPNLVVLLGSRDSSRGEEAVKKLQEEDRLANVEPVQIDLDDIQSIKHAAQHVKERFGGLDILVNNAGMAFKGDAFDEHVARTTINTNYSGTKHVCEHFMPLIRDYGRVVMVSSRAGTLDKLKSSELRAKFSSDDLTIEQLDNLVEQFINDIREGKYSERGWPKSTYGVSKIAMTALTRIIARQEQQNPNRKGVLTNACCPGWCRTDMAGQRAPRSAEDGAEVAEFLSLLPQDATFNGKFFGENRELRWLDGSYV